MKYVKTFERYKFIEQLELQDLEAGIEIIEKAFDELKIEEIYYCLTDIEDLFPKFSIGYLCPYLLKPGVGFQNLVCNGETLSTKFLRTEDYFNNMRHFDENKNLKCITTALIGQSMKLQKLDWETILGNPEVYSHFKEKIKDESIEIPQLLNSGWIPCFVFNQKDEVRLNITLYDHVISVMDDIRIKLEGVLDKTIVFIPPKQNFSFLIIDKKFISQ